MNIGEKLQAIEGLFRRSSKSYQAAIEVVKADRDLSIRDRELICEKLGISPKTLSYVLTRLRKAGLYGPPTVAELKKELEKEVEQTKKIEPDSETTETDNMVKEQPPRNEPPKEEVEPDKPKWDYVTREEFNQLIQEMRALSAVLMGQTQEPAYTAFQEAPQYNEPPENSDPEDTVERSRTNRCKHEANGDLGEGQEPVVFRSCPGGGFWRSPSWVRRQLERLREPCNRGLFQTDGGRRRASK